MRAVLNQTLVWVSSVVASFLVLILGASFSGRSGVVTLVMVVGLPMVALFTITMFTTIIFWDRLDALDDNALWEIVKDICINLFSTFCMGLCLNVLMAMYWSGLNQLSGSTVIMVSSLAYVIPYSLIGLKLYMSSFDELELSKGGIQCYIGLVVSSVLASQLLTSFYGRGVVFGILFVGVSYVFAYVLGEMLTTDKKELTEVQALS